MRSIFLALEDLRSIGPTSPDGLDRDGDVKDGNTLSLR